MSQGFLSVLGSAVGVLPGVGGVSGGLLNGLGNLYPSAVEPEIPSEMDDWDYEFERVTGSLPEFSPIAMRRRARNDFLRQQMIAAQSWHGPQRQLQR
jgi:hypothetical protein